MMTKFVTEQTYARIKAGNFKGLNLTNMKIRLSGDLALLEQKYEDLSTMHQDSTKVKEKIEEL